MLIDMHAHVIPGWFPEGRAGWPRMEPADVPDARQLVTDRMRFTAKHPFYNAEARVEAMAADGVDAEVVSPLPPLLDYDMAPGDARDFCRHVNEFIAGLRRAAPQRILGLGTVPLQDPDLAAAELSEVTRMGLAGIEIGSNIRGVSLGDERLRGFFAEAERLRVPVFVHATNPTFAERVPAGGLGTFGFATEISLAAASVVSSGLAEQCPDLRIAFSHGAGGFAMMLTRAVLLERSVGRGRTRSATVAGPRPGTAFPDRVRPPPLLRRARLRPAGAALPGRHARRGPPDRRHRLPGDAARAAGRPDAARDGPAPGRSRRDHLAQLLPVPGR